MLLKQESLNQITVWQDIFKSNTFFDPKTLKYFSDVQNCNICFIIKVNPSNEN